MKQELNLFREQMKRHHIDVAYIPTADYHESEYVHEYFKIRQWLSGFTGSAGTMIITHEEACLWTDGRYFIQAEQQLYDSGITLMKQGAEGVPTIVEYLKQTVQKGQTMHYDGRVVSSQVGQQLRLQLADKELTYQADVSLIDAIWSDRPGLPDGPIFTLPNEISGQSRETKIKSLRDVMEQLGVTHHVISSLDDIAWLLNVRGSDVRHTPVVLSYVLISHHSLEFFVDHNKISQSIHEELLAANITVQPYEDIYPALKKLTAQDSILVDSSRINDAIRRCIPVHTKVVDEVNPTQMMKAKKNEVELANLRISHVKDGVAVTKFMYWLKTNIGKMKITELSATRKLLELRQEQTGFMDNSFSTIAAYKGHAAMMHYSATEDSDFALEPEGLFLLDSGGQYMGGTTDITRTIVLGPFPQEHKLHYTTVVKGMLSLSNAIFLEGTKGINLDILARGPLWSMNIDYQSGTGHGVGYMLGVHEGPQGIRWRNAQSKPDGSVLYPGMVVTNEPGVYVAGSHGIRVENELIVRTAAKNEYGQFLSFETMTFAPIDLAGIDASLLSQQDKQWLNDYHALVWDQISPHLDQAEKDWLREQVTAI